MGVKVQGKYLPTHMTHGLSVTKQVAVSGSFIKDHILIVGPRSATYDGQPILEELNSNFDDSSAGVHAVFDDQGKVMQASRKGKTMRVIHLTLPSGVSIQINRWTIASEGDYINVKINLEAPLPGMDGHCGNWNGDSADDDRLQIRARMGKTGVPAEEILFPGPKTPVVAANRPDINDCPQQKLEAAEKFCKKEEGNFFPSIGCLVDVCFGGKVVA